MKERKAVSIISVLFILVYVVLLAAVFYNDSEKLEVGASGQKGFTVVIDAGHGGIDGGAEGVVTGVIESDINLAIANKLKTLCERAGITVVMTRTTAGGLYGLPAPGFKKRDMKRRAEIINDADPALVVSIHQNTCGSHSRRGSLVYYKPGYEKGLVFAKAVCTRINDMPEKPRDCVPMTEDFFILNNSPCPAVIVECGFLSNAEDEKMLCDDMYREKLAYAVLLGITDYMFIQ